MSTKQAIVEKLAAVYGFKVDEALEHLKGKKKMVEKAAVIIPFIEPIKGWCDGLKLNHNLFTQCSNKPMSTGTLCKTCQKQADTTGKPTCGLASERATEGAAWRDPKGRQPAQFGKVMEKLKVEREEVEGELKRLFGEADYDEHFIVTKTSRGRPKKDETEKKQRGRPKKSKEVVPSGGDDLITALIAQAREAQPETTDDQEAEKETAKAAKEAEKEAAKAEKEAAKAAKKAAKEAEKEAAKAAKKAAKEAEKEAAKAAKKAEKEAAKATKKAAKEEVVNVAEEELTAESPEEELKVAPKMLNGVEYLVAEDGRVFDMTTQEIVGRWDEASGWLLEMDS